ncbi:YjzD family protein [Bacillus sp. FJAT-29790]|uniref:YjzD family protein n=1 Tax=Bacillus sp. FJAT-29790 TaxID=1895002 RepID=UPI001C247077|nr:YjzD family protein [Bacillus sp. FJAT-29790]MBU8877452.1 YjzD family protein [Bacillus sp. FJAT-29790]
MRFFMTFFWTFLLVQMLTYVVGNMNGAGFDFKAGSILAVGATILIFVVSSIIPEGPTEKEGLN